LSHSECIAASLVGPKDPTLEGRPAALPELPVIDPQPDRVQLLDHALRWRGIGGLTTGCVAPVRQRVGDLGKRALRELAGEPASFS
jgi:hypothetical protein